MYKYLIKEKAIGKDDDGSNFLKLSLRFAKILLTLLK